MKRINIYFATLALLVLCSCAKENVKKSFQDPYAFTFDVSASDGAIGITALKESPEVRLLMTSGEDVDYKVSYSFNGEQFEQTHVWLGKTRVLSFAAENKTGEYILNGVVSREDGKGESKGFSVSFRIAGVAVQDIKDIVFTSGTFDGLSCTAIDGRAQMPALDRGRLSMMFVPAESNTGDISFTGSIIVDPDSIVRKADGTVEADYESAASGSFEIKCDWGDSFSKSVAVDWYPTVIIEPASCAVEMYSYTDNSEFIGITFKSQRYYVSTFNVIMNCEFSNVDSLQIAKVSTTMARDIATESGCDGLSFSAVSGTAIDTLKISNTGTKTVSLTGRTGYSNYWPSTNFIEWSVRVGGVKNAGENEVSPAFWIYRDKSLTLSSGSCDDIQWDRKPVTVALATDYSSDLYLKYTNGDDISSYAIRK